MGLVNYNGKITDADQVVLPHNNSAFRYGQGLIETMLVRDGEIPLAAGHWHRLFNGLDRLGFSVPVHFTAGYIQEEVMRIVTSNHLLPLCRVRVEVFSGVESIYDRDRHQPQFLIECFPLEERMTRLNENGLICGLAEGLKKAPDTLANLKTSNMLLYAQAARQALEKHWNDALIQHVNGNIIESTIANVFWVSNGIVYTPPLSEGCVAGVMRTHLMTSIQEIITCVETPLTLPQLLAADEVFLTNAVRGIRWVKQIQESSYNNHLIRKICSSINF